MTTEIQTEPNYYSAYNYPPLNRKDTSSNRCLDSRDFPPRKFKQLDTKRDWSLNNYSLDIKGASPSRIGLYSQKPDYSLEINDIEKAQSRPLYLPNNKPNYNLSNKDIEGSIPIGHHCMPTNRHINPLNPIYPLPSCESKFEEYNPPFIRDSININDIEGAQPRKVVKWKIRDNMNKYNEIKEHDKLIKDKRYHRLVNSTDEATIRNSLNEYKDVYAKKNFSSRHINPLDPVYEITYNYGQDKAVYGPIEDNKPNVFSRFNTEKESFNLKTSDIPGAYSSTKTAAQKFYFKFGREYLYNPTDIDGSHSGSRVDGLKTKRCLNPMEPDYQFIGRTEELINDNFNKNNNPYNRLLSERNNNRNSNNKSQLIDHHKFKIVPDKTSDKNNNNNSNSNNNCNNANEDKFAYNSDIDATNDSSNIKQINEYQNNNAHNCKSYSNINYNNNNSSSNISNNNNNCGIMNMKSQVIKQNNDIIHNPEDEFKGLPVDVDEVKFDREKFGKKPSPYFSLKHEDNVYSGHLNRQKKEEYLQSKKENGRRYLELLYTKAKSQQANSNPLLTRSDYLNDMEKLNDLDKTNPTYATQLDNFMKEQMLSSFKH